MRSLSTSKRTVKTYLNINEQTREESEDNKIIRKPGGDRHLRRTNNILRRGMFEVVLLILLALLGSFALQWMLALALHTNTPLHTPISGSMEPTLKIGDLLIIRGGLRAEDIHASPKDGDIIVFHNPENPNGLPIVHRAIEKIQKDGKWYFLTKGDNNPYDDYRAFGWLVPEDYIIGKVIFVIPKVGYILRGLDEKIIYVGGYAVTLRMLLMAVNILALLYLELTSYKEESGRSKKEKH